jgi:hypothetical protein
MSYLHSPYYIHAPHVGSQIVAKVDDFRPGVTDTLSISSLTRFRWDEFYVIGPSHFAPIDIITELPYEPKKIVKASWPDYYERRFSKPLNYYGKSLLVFVRNGVVVHAEYFTRTHYEETSHYLYILFDSSCISVPLSPNDAVFRIYRNPANYQILRLISPRPKVAE